MWALVAIAVVVAWLYAKGSRAITPATPGTTGDVPGANASSDYPLTAAPQLPDVGPSPDWLSSYDPANDPNMAGIEPVLGPVRPF